MSCPVFSRWFRAKIWQAAGGNICNCHSTGAGKPVNTADAGGRRNCGIKNPNAARRTLEPLLLPNVDPKARAQAAEILREIGPPIIRPDKESVKGLAVNGRLTIGAVPLVVGAADRNNANAELKAYDTAVLAFTNHFFAFKYANDGSIMQKLVSPKTLNGCKS